MDMRVITACIYICLILLCMRSSSSSVMFARGQDVGSDGGGRRQLVPAMFVFGDSLIDNGNNNNLPSLAKANYFPYGIDFAGGPTGRFSNGYTIVDGIANLLGLPLTPAYSEAVGSQVFHGVNYASAAAGILDVTGGNFVGRIPFNQQIRNFESTLSQIGMELGATEAVANSIKQSIIFIGFGSNDYLNNYMMPNYNTKNQYNAEQFADLLMQQYTRQLTRLYSLGARKFAVAGVGAIACVPSILAQSAYSKCSVDVDNLIAPFNRKVKAMISNLNENLPGAKFIYLDVYRMFVDILANPTQYGFSVIDRGCCGIGRNRGQISCLPLQAPCARRDQYVFWDAFHPTEAVNILLARNCFSGNTNVAFPMNIQQLANVEV